MPFPERLPVVKFAVMTVPEPVVMVLLEFAGTADCTAGETVAVVKKFGSVGLAAKFAVLTEVKMDAGVGVTLGGTALVAAGVTTVEVTTGVVVSGTVVGMLETGPRLEATLVTRVSDELGGMAGVLLGMAIATTMPSMPVGAPRSFSLFGPSDT